MLKPKKINKNNKSKHPSESWEGLSNQPRNENLAKIKDFGLFEKQELGKNKTIEKL